MRKRLKMENKKKEGEKEEWERKGVIGLEIGKEEKGDEKEA